MDKKKLQTGFNSFLDTKVANLPRNHKILILLAIPLVLGALFYFLIFSAKTEVIQGLENKAAKLNEEIATAKGQAGKLNQHLAEMAAMEQQFEEASILIPDNKEIPSLLTSISGQATGSGLEIASFTPGTETAKEFYAEIPVSIAVTGTYHNFGYFLDSVSKLPRIVNVSNITMGSPRDDEGEMLLNSRVNLVTYKFIEPSNEPKPSKK